MAVVEHAPVDTASLRATTKQKKESITIDIEWKGQHKHSILLVSIDSKNAELMQQRRILPEEIELFGVVFMRAIGKEGRDSLTLPRDQLTRHTSSSSMVLKIYVVDRATALVYESPFARDSIFNVRSAQIWPKDCGSRFRVLCAEDSARQKHFPKTKPMAFKAPKQGFVGAKVHFLDIWALLKSVIPPVVTDVRSG